MDPGLSSVLAALAVGLAVASAPGPVPAIVVSEAMRGGIGRGLAAAGGAAVAFGLHLVLLALGVSIAAPSGDVVRLLQAVGGVAHTVNSSLVDHAEGPGRRPRRRPRSADWNSPAVDRGPRGLRLPRSVGAWRRDLALLDHAPPRTAVSAADFRCSSKSG
jgi:hypothetical protein